MHFGAIIDHLLRYENISALITNEFNQPYIIKPIFIFFTCCSIPRYKSLQHPMSFLAAYEYIVMNHHGSAPKSWLPLILFYPVS